MATSGPPQGRILAENRRDHREITAALPDFRLVTQATCQEQPLKGAAMTYVTDPADSAFDQTTRRNRPFARMMGGIMSSLAPRKPEPAIVPLPPTGPAIEALIDADYERMASHGSWESLRDSLRASASPPAARKRA
jgi:hypothetical protein